MGFDITKNEDRAQILKNKESLENSYDLGKVGLLQNDKAKQFIAAVEQYEKSSGVEKFFGVGNAKKAKDTIKELNSPYNERFADSIHRFSQSIGEKGLSIGNYQSVDSVNLKVQKNRYSNVGLASQQAQSHYGAAEFAKTHEYSSAPQTAASPPQRQGNLRKSQEHHQKLPEAPQPSTIFKPTTPVAQPTPDINYGKLPADLKNIIHTTQPPRQADRASSQPTGGVWTSHGGMVKGAIYDPSKLPPHLTRPVETPTNYGAQQGGVNKAIDDLDAITKVIESSLGPNPDRSNYQPLRPIQGEMTKKLADAAAKKAKKALKGEVGNKSRG